MSTNWYQLLALDPSASLAEIKAAYRRCVGVDHADRHGNTDAANSRMRDLNEAYSVLSDPQRRAAYDRELRSKLPLNDQLAALRRDVDYFADRTIVVAAAVTTAASAIGTAVSAARGLWQDTRAFFRRR